MDSLCEFTLFEIFPQDVQYEILGWYQSAIVDFIPNYKRLPPIVKCFKDKPYREFKRRVISEYMRTPHEFKYEFKSRVFEYANEHVYLDNGKPKLHPFVTGTPSTIGTTNTASPDLSTSPLSSSFQSNDNQNSVGETQTSAVIKPKRRSKNKPGRVKSSQEALPPSSSSSPSELVCDSDPITICDPVLPSPVDDELAVLRARVLQLDKEILLLKQQLSGSTSPVVMCSVSIQTEVCMCSVSTQTEVCVDSTSVAVQAEPPSIVECARSTIDASVVPVLCRKSLRLSRYLSERKYVSNRLYRRCINAFHHYCPIPFRDIKALFSAYISEWKSGTNTESPGVE